jgi:pyruvate/2-oxoglutarate dehydrogenase complex dihydrolipoamide acyltransferase (E2) component
VIAATFPDVPMQGGKGILLVLFGILLPRIIEHPTYRAAIGAGFDRLGAWVRRLFRTREQVEAERAAALRAERAAAATERAAQPAEPTEAEIEAAHLAQIERDREKAAAEQRAREKADKAKIDHWNRTFADTGEA